jgi:formate dehydrogenase iron-sulfur subunit
MNGVLVDLTKCIGCGSCTVACKMYNNNPWVEQKAPTDGETAQLAAENWTVIRKSVVIKKDTVKNDTVKKDADDQNGTDHNAAAEGREVWRFAKMQCMHCIEPSCVSACPSRAFQKTADGPVLYYPRNCIGCRYCMIGCPFNIPKFEWDNPLPVIAKCMMCSGRVSKGESPACVTVCPTNVMKFGDLDELLAEAKATVAAGPDKYIEHIYGEEEAGGTCWIYISDTPFAELGFRTGDQVPNRPFPSYTSTFMHNSPVVGGIWGLVLAGLYFITRRNDVKAAAKKNKKKGKKEKG